MMDINIQEPSIENDRVGCLYTDWGGDLYVRTEDCFAAIGDNSDPETYQLDHPELTPLAAGTVVTITI